MLQQFWLVICSHVSGLPFHVFASRRNPEWLTYVIELYVHHSCSDVDVMLKLLCFSRHILIPGVTQLYSTMESRFQQESQRRHENYSNRLLQFWIGLHGWLGGLWSPRKKRKTGDLVERFLSGLWGMFLSSVLLLGAVSVFKAFSPWSRIYRWGWSCSVFG